MQEFIAMDFGEVDEEMTDAVEAEKQAANDELLPVTVLSGFLGAPPFLVAGSGFRVMDSRFWCDRPGRMIANL